MTKVFLLIAAATLGTAAFAQSTTATPDMQAAPAASPTDTSSAPSMAPGTSATPDMQAAPSPSTDMTANSSATMPMSNPSTATATTTAASDYPVCSRTVTDKCIQRGAARRHRG